METQELRVGNFIDYNGSFLIIGCIDNTSESVKVNTFFGGWSELNISEISSIKITEDILNIIDFDKITNLVGVRAVYKYGRITISQSNSGHWYYKQRVIYLHDLQNIFYSEYGKELETSKL